MEIRAENVVSVLGGTKILHGVEIHIQKKELIGLLGPNGSGKSTLLRCIYRTLKPTEGAVFLGGRPIEEYSYKESAKRVSVLAQHNYYNFEFSVEDVVMMGRAPHKKALDRDTREDYELVSKCLQLVGMEQFRKRAFSTLSGGEQQRVILARALAQQTPCLILDEPTNHLDIKYQIQLMNLIKGLNRTVISAVHDLNIAAMYCDRIYVMKEGRIAASGTPKEVLVPELIRQVYEVNAEVFEDSSGILRILYNQ